MHPARNASATKLDPVESDPQPQVSEEGQRSPESRGIPAEWTVEEIVPMVATVIIAAVLVALLVLYISEFARITVQGNFQQEVQGKLQVKYREIEALRVEVASLKGTKRIVKRAQQEGFVRLTQREKLPVAASLLPSRPALGRPGPSPSYLHSGSDASVVWEASSPSP